jgi:hypothetical protein
MIRIEENVSATFFLFQSGKSYSKLVVDRVRHMQASKRKELEDDN